MQIEITESLIRAGRKNSNAHCPVGLAVRKVTGKRMKMVGHANDDQTFITLVGDDRVYYGPGSVMRFVYDFDMGRCVKPLNFALRDEIEN